MKTVAVVVPTYQRPDRLRGALESVRAQTYDRTESVVVDGDPDRSAEPVAEEFGARYVHQPDPPEGVAGPADARDRGVAATEADLVRFLDDDDRLRASAVERQVAELRDGVGLVYCGIAREGSHESLPDSEVSGDALERALMLQVGPLVPSTMLVRRDLLESVGPMRELPHDDAALVIELARRTELAFVDSVLVDRGAPDDGLAGSFDSLEGRKRTVEAYDDLYDRYPSRVRETALARVAFQEGELRLRRDGWSPAAVRAFLRAVRHAPDFQPVYVGALVAALFGRRGWELGVGVYDVLAGDRRRGNAGRIA